MLIVFVAGFFIGALLGVLAYRPLVAEALNLYYRYEALDEAAKKSLEETLSNLEKV